MLSVWDAVNPAAQRDLVELTKRVRARSAAEAEESNSRWSKCIAERVKNG
jgi:hypothetical protein